MCAISSAIMSITTYQVFCNVLWVLEAYWLYFAMTLGMMLIFEATVVKGRLRSLTELRGEQIFVPIPIERSLVTAIFLASANTRMIHRFCRGGEKGKKLF